MHSADTSISTVQQINHENARQCPERLYNLARRKIAYLRFAVAEPGEDIVVMFAQFGGDADLDRGLGELPGRAVDL